jgi:hypothetical protein
MFAWASGWDSTIVRIGIRGASAMNSSPSRRVRFATERMLPLAPQQLVGERRDVGYVDAGADDRAALSRARTSIIERMSILTEGTGARRTVPRPFDAHCDTQRMS